MYAWVENNTIRDLSADPESCFHPEVAKFYDTEVSDEVQRGWTLEEGVWTAPVIPPYIPGPDPDPPGPVVPELDVLSTDLWSVLADGTSFATVTYTSETDVHFSVNDIIYKVTPVDYIATLEVTADAPGAININVRDKQLVIVATEV